VSRGNWHVCEAAEPIGAGGKHHGAAAEPTSAGVTIGGQELAIARDGLDARPQAAGCEARPAVAARLVGGGAGAPRLMEDRAPAEDVCPGPLAVGGDRGFDRGDLCTQLGEDLLRVAELGREGEREGEGGGHGACGAKEVMRPGGVEYAAGELKVIRFQ